METINGDVMKWRFIETGFNDAATNMAIDEAILTCHGRGKVPPTLRFYRWRPPAISLGYFQRLEKEVNAGLCRELGIQVVRRLTGGRAVLHDRELTYSVVVSESHPLMPATVTESYKVISGGLLAGLKRLGICAAIAPRNRSRSGELSPAACFNTLSSYELTVNGKKIAGSAQVRRQGVILQHGSLPWELDADKLFLVLKFSGRQAADRMKQAFLAKATCMRAVTEREIPWAEISAALREGFKSALGVELETGRLTAEETRLALELVTLKYKSQEWNNKY
ncbi:lipoate--protein ligase family protein [Pelotomaculum terephthalicicum JT]|uniref:lipoate--protein ligase family protein n=1 Tax=Pelotomaculum terephthalicicum TaxID=206393 RepID=UPI0009C79D12|nr:lipoate--protein ligase family protein [Pelotomaculum terephthalicicum]MCG9967168.1 lipoate--protein ligase family protein [Pelotomaculum terephthalicicum JT]OPY62081.1 MAG: Octanoyltransferase LipM [Pelotomaculum sp. PtaU1.Bin065]